MIWWPQYNDQLLLTHNTTKCAQEPDATSAGRLNFHTIEPASRPQLTPRILRWLTDFLKNLCTPYYLLMWRCSLAKYHRRFGDRAAFHLQRRRCMQQVLHTALKHSQDNFQSRIMKRSKLETLNTNLIELLIMIGIWFMDLISPRGNRGI